MAPLTSEWRDESVRRLSSGPEGDDEVALSQSPYAWKPLVSESRRVRPAGRTSRYPPSLLSPLQGELPDRPELTSLLTGNQATTHAGAPRASVRVGRGPGRRLLQDHTLPDQDDGWELLAVGSSGALTPSDSLSHNDSQAWARELTAARAEDRDQQVLSSIRAISTTLLEQPPTSLIPTTTRDLSQGAPSDKTFQVDDDTSLAEASSLDGRRLSGAQRPSSTPPLAQSPPSQMQQQDEDTWLPVSLAVPSKRPDERPGDPAKISKPSKVTADVLAQFLSGHQANISAESTSPASKTHYQYATTYRPSEHYVASSSVHPPYRPSLSSSARPPTTYPYHTSRPPTTNASPIPGKNPSHFTFSATIGPSTKPHDGVHYQHYHEKPSKGVVSVIKRPVTMHHSSWGVGTPKPNPTVINNYNDPAWYPRPPTAPPPKPQIIIVEDKIPEYQLSSPRPSNKPVAQTSKPESNVKCPNIIITASSLAENHNLVNKEGCSELNIVIQSSASNLNSAPGLQSDPILVSPAPYPPPPDPMRPASPSPTQIIIARPEPTAAPAPAVQADPAAGAGASTTSTAVATSPTNTQGFWGSLFNGSATRFGISFWSGVLLAPVIVLMAVGSLLSPWLVPYFLSRRSNRYGLLFRSQERAALRDAVLDDAQRRAHARSGTARGTARCRVAWARAAWRRRHRRTPPDDTVWWDEGRPPGSSPDT